MEGSESEPSNTMQVEEIPPPLTEQPPVPPVEPSFVEDPPQTGESAEINVLHADEPAAADDPSTSEEPEAAAPEPCCYARPQPPRPPPRWPQKLRKTIEETNFKNGRSGV